ncbi:intercellular adhesion molecule 2-like isoform X2 [Lissotriton helveticus]
MMCNSTIVVRGWETSLRKEEGTMDKYWITTNLLNITQWISDPQCFTIDSSSASRTTQITIVAYQAPSHVSVDLPAEMVVGQSYSVICQVFNIAPKRNLSVSIFKGSETLRRETFSQDLTNTSTDVTITYDVTAQRMDQGAEYSCIAVLDLRPNGRVFNASSLRKSVSIVGPPININISTERTDFQKGDNFTVKCYAEGNPSPMFTWHLPSNESTLTSRNGSTVTIIAAQGMHSGTYECRAQNRFGTTMAQVDILLKAPGFPVWATVIIIIVSCLTVVGGAWLFWKYR